MLSKTSAICVIPLLLCSCRGVVETHPNHVVRAGESGILMRQGAQPVYVAVNKSDVHALARAVEGGDETTVRQLVTEGKALEVPANTPVHVERESFNERQVKITNGAYSGKIVWVPFAWLQPARN